MRSLDLSTDQNIEYIGEMKNEIAELRLLLDITRNELYNLIVENYGLVPTMYLKIYAIVPQNSKKNIHN